MAPRRRQPNKIGNTRMDAALDAMKQLGFEEKIVKETVEELLDVYEGMQGWPFIEEASYKLLIESLLCAEEDKDDAGKDGIGETSSAATPATGITDVGSSGLLAHDSISRGSNDLESATQTNDHLDSTLIGDLEVEAGAMDTNVPTERGGDGESNHKTFGRNVENTIVKSSVIESSKRTDKLPHNGRRPRHGWISTSSDDSEEEDLAMDTNVPTERGGDGESNHKTFGSNVENTIVKSSVIESSKRTDKLPHNGCRPCYGWITTSSDDNDEEEDLVLFRLPKPVEKLIGKSVALERPRRKSRWDERPDDV